MTRFAYLIIISLLCFGCTHNNGDIGPLFGTWVLDGMTVDGDKQDIGPDDTFMQFQGKIVMTTSATPCWSTVSAPGSATAT